MSVITWVKFIQAYSFFEIYINHKFVSSVQRHPVWSDSWTEIICGNEKYTLLEPFEQVLKKLDIKK